MHKTPKGVAKPEEIIEAIREDQERIDEELAAGSARDGVIIRARVRMGVKLVELKKATKGVANLPGGHSVQRGAGEARACWGAADPRTAMRSQMDQQPQLSARDLVAQMRGPFEKLCAEVAAAVNQAQAGQVINQSEEKVRDLLADFRQATFQAALQLRLAAAQAAFPPSASPPDATALAEQGP